MFPILLQWGSFILPAWHTLYALGAIAAYFLLIHLSRKHAPQIPEAVLASLYAICYISGYFGARLLSIWIEEPEVEGWIANFTALLRFGPMTFYGGALAAFIAGVLYTKIKRIPLGVMADLCLPAGLLALAIGRIGCFLNGDDYGLPVALKADGSYPFYAVILPNLEDQTPRYAVQLYEAFAVFILVAGLVGGYRKLQTSIKPGAVAYMGVIVYANLRLVLEMLRGDFRGSVLSNWLSTSQFISLIILVVCALILPIWLRKKAPLGVPIESPG